MVGSNKLMKLEFFPFFYVIHPLTSNRRQGIHTITRIHIMSTRYIFLKRTLWNVPVT